MKSFLPRSACLVFTLFLLLVLLWACAHYQGDGSVTTIIATSEAFKSFDGEYENTTYFKTHKPESIAVLPFSSLEQKPFTVESKGQHPEDIVRRGLYNHISSLPFKDMELFQTDTRLKNANLLTTEAYKELILSNPNKLKSLLGVDAVVTGDVTHFDRYYAGIYSQVAVGCEVHMWDLTTGKLLWRAKHVSRAHAGGLSLNPLGLLLSAAASVWNMRATEMLSQTDEVFREIVSTIELPEGALITQQPPPSIDLFAAMRVDRPFVAGKDIAFRLVGDPDCKAYVDLGSYKSAIRLTPVPAAEKQVIAGELMSQLRGRYQDSGQELSEELASEMQSGLASREIYEGSYTVEPGEERYGLVSKAYLVNSLGDQGTRVDVANLIDIDANPPGVPSALAPQALNHKIKLNWEANPEKDLKGYELWTSRSPISGFSLAKFSEANRHLLEDQPNFDAIYIKVRAVDQADNTGPFSLTVSAVPLPETNLYDLPQPDTALGGNLATSHLLVREKSPYEVTADLHIKDGAILYLEPGVQVHFSAGTALIVDGGGLVAYGEQARPVWFLPMSLQAPPGAWEGLILNDSSQVRLRHINVVHAANGITIQDSSPEIYAATIRGCSQSGLYLKSNAKPEIICTTLADNGGQGGLVIEGEGVAPRVRQSIWTHNEPFHVQSYTPTLIDLRENYWGAPVPNPDLFLGNVTWEPALSAPPSNCSPEH